MTMRRFLIAMSGILFCGVLLTCTNILWPLAVDAPQPSIAGGSYATAQTVSLSDKWAGTTIYYTTDGSTPTTASSAYTSPIAVGASGGTEETVRAIAVKPGVSTSDVASATYWISGTITTYAGNGTKGFAGDSGPGTSAELNGPNGVAVDASGNLYIADTLNNRIRKVTAGGTITTVAGNGLTAYSGDNGPATSAAINNPAGVAVDTSGNLYIADYVNARIRKVSNSGTITTIAGTGVQSYSGDNGPATSAELKQPAGVAVDPSGNVYIADEGNSVIRKVNTGGIITTIAGNGTYGDNGDNGAATAASLQGPAGVALDSSGNLYIADYYDQVIRKVDNSGIITTVAGIHGNSHAPGFSGDLGSATSAELYSPSAVAVDAVGNLFILDSQNNRVRKVDPSGIINTVAGNGTPGYVGDGGPAILAELALPGLSNWTGIAVDSSGNIYIGDNNNNVIRKVH
jgi:trimeric autotransporter adhesin